MSGTRPVVPRLTASPGTGVGHLSSPQCHYHATREVSQLLGELSLTLPFVSSNTCFNPHTQGTNGHEDRQSYPAPRAGVVAWRLYAGHVVFGKPRMRSFFLYVRRSRSLYMEIDSLVYTKQRHTDPYSCQAATASIKSSGCSSYRLTRTVLAAVFAKTAKRREKYFIGASRGPAKHALRNNPRRKTHHRQAKCRRSLVDSMHH
jgi:hypothetical protein